MKTHFNILIASCILLTLCTCTSDVNNNNNVGINIEGKWHVSEYTLTKAWDINRDGTSSQNFLSEMSCYTLEITFTSDGKYSLKQKDIGFILDNNKCGNDAASDGFYVINGTVINLYNTQTDAITNVNKLPLEFSYIAQELFIQDTHAILGKQKRVLKRK